MPIRHEAPADAPVIARIVERAFADHPLSQGTEVAIVRGLHSAADLGAA
ncbi:hypothetical protein [Ideonella sp. A 288]|nr:hypothetical protein [Ideonella sp. A 288]